MNVYLFDIDGTLINSGGAGMTTLYEAFEAEFQVKPRGRVNVHGCTDRGIAASLFAMHGLDDSLTNFERFRDAYLSRLPRQLSRHSGFVLPGVDDLLGALGLRSDVAVGLLTGNVASGARIKLEHFSLWQHFRFGGYGERHHGRPDVAREALASASEYLGYDVHGSKVWVIGDTPADIECGRAINARCAAVLTGQHTKAELEAARPDVLLNDLREFDALLA